MRISVPIQLLNLLKIGYKNVFSLTNGAHDNFFRNSQQDIDVGPSNGSKEPCLLVQSQLQASYLILNYCWGQKPYINSTSATLQAKKESIKMSELPKLHQDAITLARKLGVRCLWIDSLCILQDSKEGWARESATMSSIYANALLTITAQSSLGAHEGFLN